MPKMNRREELNDFFENLKKIIMLNPQESIDIHLIYKLLMIYDVDRNDFGQNLYDDFDFWKEHFYSKQNIDVYISPYQSAFLQFNNSSNNSSEFVKLYVSLDKNSIREGVLRIFDFLEENNIEHHSKVANQIRSDEIVLRIKKSDDARKVVDFINNDKFLTKNAKRTNPFLMRSGIVGLAYDNKLSYNSVVSFLINEYISSIDYNNISTDGFINFVHNYINDLFPDKEKLDRFLNSSYAREEYSRIKDSYFTEKSLAYYLINVKSVMELAENNLTCNDDFDNFLTLYEKSINAETKSMMKLDFISLLGEDAGDDYQDAKELLDDYILYAYAKYNQDVKRVLFQLEGFIYESGDYITRDNNYRKRFKANLNKEIILEITSGDLKTYIENVIKINENSYFDIFLEACVATFQKYGYKQLSSAINNGLLGDYGFFTNDQGLRNSLMTHVSLQTFNKNIVALIGTNDFSLYDNVGDAVADIISGGRTQ